MAKDKPNKKEAKITPPPVETPVPAAPTPIVTETAPSRDDTGFKVQEPTDIRSVDIELVSVENLKPLWPVSDLFVKMEYCEQTLGVSEKVPITDDPSLDTNFKFSFVLDVLSPKEVDLLVSSPITITLNQCPGTFEVDSYKIAPLHAPAVESKHSLETLVSMYEAYTGKVLDKKEKSKDKLKTKPQSKESSKGAKAKPEKPKKGEKQSITSSKLNRKSNVQSVEIPFIAEQRKDVATVVGVCTLDLMPLIFGTKTFTEALEIKPPQVFIDDRLLTYKNRTKAIVTASIEQKLDFGMKPTILCYTLESIYNLPALVTPEMDCRVCAWIPLKNSAPVPHVLSRSKYKTTKQEDYQMKCWPSIPSLGDGNTNTTLYRLNANLSNVKNYVPRDLNSIVKDGSIRLEYNYLKRDVLMVEGVSCLTDHLKKFRKICLEFYVTTRDHHSSTGDDSTGRVTKPESRRKSREYLHLMAIADISLLLYPGVTKTRVALPLRTYQEEEMHSEAGIYDSFFLIPREKSMPKASVSEHKLDKSIVGGKGDKKKKGGNGDTEKSSKKSKNKTDLESSKGSAKSKKSGKKMAEGSKNDLRQLLPAAPEPAPVMRPSEFIYNENGDPTFVIIEFELSDPLVAERNLEELSESLHKIVTTRPAIPKHIVNSKYAEDYYHEVVNNIVQDLKDIYFNYSREKKQCLCGDQADFLTYLRRCGGYQKYIMSLTKAASILVNKKFEVDSNILKQCNRKQQEIIGNIFIYLVSQVNNVLNKQLCSPLGFTFSKSINTIQNILYYAQEAAELRKFALAARYYTECLCFDENDPNVWCSLAIFHLEMDSLDFTFGYLNEALSRKLDHNKSLLLYAMLLSDKGKFEDAETCFLNILVHEKKWVAGWGVLYIFYSKWEHFEGLEFAEEMAHKHINNVSCDHIIDQEDLAWTPEMCPNTVFFKTAITLIKLRMFKWAENALAYEVNNYPGLVNYLLAVICYYKGDYEHALIHLDQAKFIQGWDYGIVSLTGHCYLWMGMYEKAKAEYAFVVESYNRPDDIHLLYVNYSKALSMLGDIQAARKMILLACKYHPTPTSWLKAGILYYEQNDFISAEECFIEANMCDNRLAAVWAYLALINIKLDRQNEFQICYQQALKNEVSMELFDLINEELGMEKKAPVEQLH